MEKETGRKKSGIPWHRWFGNLFVLSLTPLGVEVLTDYPVMTETPEADIVIIRKKHSEWTREQLRFLPDGIRNSRAEHIILEFKYTESLSEDALCQALGYRIFYKLSRGLKDGDIQAFLISSKTPREAMMESYGYGEGDVPGVLRSAYPLLAHLPILSLNDLSDQPHNTFVRLFASKKKERLSALHMMRQRLADSLPEKYRLYIVKLAEILFGMGGRNMEDMELTPEEMAEVAALILECLPPEAVLSKFGAEERLAGLGPEERLAGLGPEERLAGLGPEEIEAYLRKLRRSGRLGDA